MSLLSLKRVHIVADSWMNEFKLYTKSNLNLWWNFFIKPRSAFLKHFSWKNHVAAWMAHRKKFHPLHNYFCEFFLWKWVALYLGWNLIWIFSAKHFLFAYEYKITYISYYISFEKLSFALAVVTSFETLERMWKY